VETFSGGASDPGSGGGSSTPPPADPPAGPAPDPDPSDPPADPGDPGDPGDVSFPILQPGSGWAGPTPQPAAVGDPSEPGYDAKAIARWDVVPFQTFDEKFHIGVVAFHMNGIERVDFSLDGGPWAPVYEMQLNPRTDVWEYTVTLDPNLLDDGQVEVRAIAWPETGEPRVLGGEIETGLDNGEHSILLSSNGGGSFQSLERYVSVNGSDETGDGSPGRPYKTIMMAARSIQDDQGDNADGGVVYLTAGNHVYGTYSFGLRFNIENRWLTIAGAPGVDPVDVRIVKSGSNDGLRARLVSFSNLTLKPKTGSDQNIVVSNGPLVDFAWISNCNLVGPGRKVDASWGGGFSGVFATDSDYSNSRDGAFGVLMRNLAVDNIGSDALSGVGIALGCRVGRIDRSGTSFHPDILQFHGSSLIENRIAFGITARTGATQGFFAGHGIGLADVAFVDCDIDNQAIVSHVGRVFQFGGPTRHMLVKDCVFVGPSHWRIDQAFSAAEVIVENSFQDHSKTSFFVPTPDRGSFSGTLPWQSSTGIVYRASQQ